MEWDPANPLHDVTNIEIALPATALSHAPRYEDIPEEFRNGTSPWYKVAQDIIYGRYQVAACPFYLKEGTDNDKLNRHLAVLIGSFAFRKAQHKEAAVAYILSLCCELLNPPA